MYKMRTILRPLMAAMALVGAAAVAQNRAPIAYAGLDRFAYTGAAIQLNGSGSDPDGDTLLRVLWAVDKAPANSSYYLEADDYPFSRFIGYAPGFYDLSFSVFDGSLWSAPDTVQIRVATNQAPVAVASVSPTTGSHPLTVQFDGSRSTDPEGLPLSYYWSFGDGSDGSYVAAGSHVYQYPGAFSATLEVTDTFGATSFDVVVVDVRAANVAPTLSPLAQLLSAVDPLAVQFTANGFDGNYDPLTYLWDFGDPSSPDNTSTSANPVHVFSTYGKHLVTVTADDGNLRTTAELWIGSTAVPEPATLILAASALGGLWCTRRRPGIRPI